MSVPSIPDKYTITVDSASVYAYGNPSMPIGAQVTGDSSHPIGAKVTGDVNQPIGTKVTGDPNQPIGTKVTGDPNQPIGTKITGDPKQPVATTVDMLNIPHLTLEDIKDIMTPKIRVHMPNYEQVSFKIFGTEIFSICLSGEIQMISQPYTPNAYESCKIECPDEDKRPFPETPKYDAEKGNGPDGFSVHSEESVKEVK
jgi:hypothetical protein